MSDSMQGSIDSAGERWVAVWRESVRASAKAVVLMDVGTFTFVALSEGGAALFGQTPEALAGRSFLDFSDVPGEAIATIELVRQGRLDGVRARRRFRLPDGTSAHIQVSGWVIRGAAAAPTLGVWVADEPSGPAAGRPRLEVQMAAPPGPPAWNAPPARSTISLDGDWRVVNAAREAAGLLATTPADLAGTRIVDMTHPDDVPALLMALAQATTDPEAIAPLRFRDGGDGWKSLWARVAAEHVDGAVCFSLQLCDRSEGAPGWPSGLPALTPREGDVMVRLLDGQRVATMARELHLSQRTIRNHLTAVFRKAGVHSQNELIELLRRPRSTGYSR
jgi:PAS domain S-box-containing protein